MSESKEPLSEDVNSSSKNNSGEQKILPAKPGERWSDYVRRLDGLPPLTDDEKAEQRQGVIAELIHNVVARSKRSSVPPINQPKTENPPK